MKPARFILNSDYCTVRNTGKGELSITIPNSIYLPAGTQPFHVIGTTSGRFGNPSDSYMIYYTSSLYNYSTPGPVCTIKPSGSSTTSGYNDTVTASVRVSGDTFTLSVRTDNQLLNFAETYAGFGMTVTAHIITFKDPFSE
jgi:hypothetical protein